jgi:type IV pilus assembly protein PilN
MIRVNLLPREERATQRAPIQFKVGEWVLPIAVMAAVLAIVTGTAVAQRMASASITKSIAEVDAQSRALAPQIERVNRLAQEKAELDLRLGVISRLEQGRTQGARFMDELARCVPDHLWLSSANQDSPGSVTLEGSTYSNLVVSDFMSRLERSPVFSNVNLEVAERADINGKSVVKFRLTSQVTPDAPATEERP